MNKYETKAIAAAVGNLSVVNLFGDAGLLFLFHYQYYKKQKTKNGSTCCCHIGEGLFH